MTQMESHSRIRRRLVIDDDAAEALPCDVRDRSEPAPRTPLELIVRGAKHAVEETLDLTALNVEKTLNSALFAATSTVENARVSFDEAVASCRETFEASVASIRAAYALRSAGVFARGSDDSDGQTGACGDDIARVERALAACVDTIQQRIALAQASVEQTMSNLRGKPLRDYEVPPVYREPYVLSGYRIGHVNVTSALGRLFFWDNESVNVWTHMLGAVSFVVIACMAFGPGGVMEGEPFGDKVVVAIYLASAFLCLMSSTIFHLFFTMSLRTMTVVQSLDWGSIPILISGSCVPILYFGFYSRPWWQCVYLAHFAAIGVLLAVLPNVPYFKTLKMRGIRTGLFVAQGFAGALPLAHAVYLDGLSEGIIQCIWWIALMGVLYLVGVFFYLSHFPERLSPGTFDIVGHSHQWWHICVISAALVHYRGILQLREYALSHARVI